MKLLFLILVSSISLLGSEVDVKWNKKDYTQFLIYGSESGVSCMDNVSDSSEARIYLPENKQCYIYLVSVDKNKVGTPTKIKILKTKSDIKKINLSW